MNESVQACKTIYSHKTFLDYNYNKRKRLKHLKFINRNKKTRNIACNATVHILGWFGLYNLNSFP